MDISGKLLEDAVTSQAAWGVFVGLLVGKPIGFLAAAWVSSRAGLTHLPRGIGWPEMIGAGIVTGIGFTVSLFIAEQALGGSSGSALEAVKAGVLAASTLAGVVGLVVLWFAVRKK